MNYNAFYMTTGVFNAVSDFVVLLIPQQTIWKLQMPLTRKLSVSALFMIGLMWVINASFHASPYNPLMMYFSACVSSAIRVYYSKVSLSYDIPYNLSIMEWWVFAEMSASFVSCCMPMIPKLFHTTWVKIFPHHPQISFRHIQMNLKTEKKKWPQLHMLEDETTERLHPSDDQESGWGHRRERRDGDLTGASSETNVSWTGEWARWVVPDLM